MNENWLELVIIAFIMLGIGVAVWKGGAANPESTGSLGSKLNRLQSEVTSVTGEVAGIRGEVRAIDSRVTEMDRRGATIDDIRGLEKKLDDQQRCLVRLDNELGQTREGIAALAANSEHTLRQVDRLYDFIVERGMK